MQVQDAVPQRLGAQHRIVCKQHLLLPRQHILPALLEALRIGRRLGRAHMRKERDMPHFATGRLSATATSATSATSAPRATFSMRLAQRDQDCGCRLWSGKVHSGV